MIFVSIFILSFVCIGVYHYKRDIFSPALIQPFLTVFMLAAAAVLEDSFIELPTSTLLMYTLGSILFVTGYWLASGLAPRAGGYGYVTVVQEEYTKTFRNVLFLIILLLLPLYIKTGIALAGKGPSQDFAINLRYSLTQSTDEEDSYGILSYAVTLALFLVTVEAAYYKNTEKRRLIATTLIALVYCIMATGRAPILLLLLCLIVPPIINGKLNAGKGILALLGIFGVVFFVYAVVLEKDGGGDTQGFVEVITVYMFGGVFGFAKLTQTLTDFDYGENLFRTLFAIAKKFDSSVEVKPAFDEYVFMPFPTNVYTVFGKAYRDFGYLGDGVYLMALGFLHGHIYSRAKTGSTYYRLGYVFTMFPLLMQFFGDQYMGLLSGWIQWLLLILVFRHFSRRGAVKHWVQ